MADFYAFCKNTNLPVNTDPAGRPVPDLPGATVDAAYIMLDLSQWGGCLWHCTGTLPAGTKGGWAKGSPPTTATLRALLSALEASHSFGAP